MHIQFYKGQYFREPFDFSENVKIQSFFETGRWYRAHVYINIHQCSRGMDQLLIAFAYKHSLCHLSFASFYLNFGVPLNIVTSVYSESV